MEKSTQKISTIENKNEGHSPFDRVEENVCNRVQMTGLLGEISEDLPGNIISMSIETHVGPLPAPAVLAEYDRICPGAGERILRMAELEQVHRHEGEKVLHFSQPATFRRGQILAFFTCLMGIGGAIVLGLAGNSAAAIALGAGPPIVLAGGFIGRKLLGSTKEFFVKQN